MIPGIWLENIDNLISNKLMLIGLQASLPSLLLRYTLLPSAGCQDQTRREQGNWRLRMRKNQPYWTIPTCESCLLRTCPFFVFVFEMVAQFWLSRSDEERAMETKIEDEEESALLNHSDFWTWFKKWLPWPKNLNLIPSKSSGVTIVTVHCNGLWQ